MKAKKQGASEVVCAVSRVAGALVGAAMLSGKKIGTYVKGPTVGGEGASKRRTGKPKQARSRKKKPAGQARTSKKASTSPKAKRSAASNASSQSQRRPSKPETGAAERGRESPGPA